MEGLVWIVGRSNSADVDDMFVATVDGEGTIALQPTPSKPEHPRARTNLMIDRGRLAGITWLEGASQKTTSVRAAAWNGRGWEPTETVAPPLGREQTLLRGIVLLDGSWLLVWAAVDTDDDIWWSRRTGRAWSQPQRLHADNDVSDVDPVLAATARGALAAWTAFDGSDFRIRLASFEGGHWREMPFASGKAAIPRTFVDLGGSPALLYDAVVPDVWNLVELADDGRVRTHSAQSRGPERVPMIRANEDSVVAFWPNHQPSAESVAEFLPVTEPDQ